MKRRVEVVAGAIIKDGLVFAAQRGSHGKTAYKWEFPGGKIEPGETPEEALRRELIEELSIEVEVHELITKIVDSYDDVDLSIATYRCTLPKGEPIKKEHIALGWFNKDQLLNVDFSKADEPTLRKIYEQYL